MMIFFEDDNNYLLICICKEVLKLHFKDLPSVCVIHVLCTCVIYKIEGNKKTDKASCDLPGTIKSNKWKIKKNKHRSNNHLHIQTFYSCNNNKVMQFMAGMMFCALAMKQMN